MGTVRWFYSGPGCTLVASLTKYHTSHATAQQAELIYTNAGEGGANKGQKSHNQVGRNPFQHLKALTEISGQGNQRHACGHILCCD